MEFIVHINELVSGLELFEKEKHSFLVDFRVLVLLETVGNFQRCKL